jgi:glycolate oxidase
MGLDLFLKRLSHVLGSKLRVDAEACEGASVDASGVLGATAAAVVYAHQVQDVQEVLKEAVLCGVPVVPRGGGTGKVGGSVPLDVGSVVLDVSRMNKVLKTAVDDGYAVVEPGVTTQFLDTCVGELGMMYPPDPASADSCTLGGNIATNAGGPRAVKYGVTARYVWGLDVVLMGGDGMRLGRESIKGVSGLPLSSLWVGSEGTLGVITRAVMHVVPKQQGVATAWIGCAHVQEADRICKKILKQAVVPRMLEVLDEEALLAVEDLLPVHLRGVGQVGVLLETDASTYERALEDMVWLCARADVDPVFVARNETEAEALRAARRGVSWALKRRYPMKWSDDIAVPRSAMLDYMRALREQAGLLGLKVSMYGHWGDGNLHVNVLCANEEERLKGDVLRNSVVLLALQSGGTLSGEHGIGITKRRFVSWEHSEAFLYWQNEVKKMWDPKGLMNPGKSYVGIQKGEGGCEKST